MPWVFLSKVDVLNINIIHLTYVEPPLEAHDR